MGTFGFVRDGNFWICQMGTYKFDTTWILWNWSGSGWIFPTPGGIQGIEELLDWFVIDKSLPSALASMVLK